MIAKSLHLPSLTRKRVRVKPSLFRESSGKTAVFALNAAERRGALVETGRKRLVGTLPTGTEKLFRTADGTLFSLAGTVLTKGEDTYTLSAPPLDILSFAGETGTEYYALTSSGLYALGETGAAAVTGAPAGTCMAVFGERLFIASGETLFYSAPLDVTDWEQSADGAGSVDLPSRGGNIVKLVPYKGQLLLFRERGITALTAPGDFLDFQAEELACAFTELIPDSAAACGSRVLFAAKDGLYALEGSTVSALESCGAEYIDLQEDVVGAAAGENYYAAVTLLSKEKCIFALTGERASLLRLDAESVAGGEFVFLREGKLYALDEAAAAEREMVIEFPLSEYGVSEARYLDAVRVEGAGQFRVSARAERGLPRHVRGRAGEELRFVPPLKGSAFSLRVKGSSGARLAAVILDIREGRA